MSIFEPSNYSFNPHGIHYALSGIVVLILGLRVLLLGPKNNTHLSFFLAAFTVVWWLLLYSIVFQSTNYEVAFIWTKIMWSGVVFISPSVYFFAVSVLELANKGRWVTLSYLMFLPFVFAVPFNILTSGVYKLPWFYFPKAGILEPYFLVLFFSQMLRVFYLFLKAWLNPALRLLKRKQIRLIFLAFFFAYFSAVDYIPNFGIQIYPIGSIPITIWASIIAYAIIRYRLFQVTPELAAPTIIATMADILLVSETDGRVVITNQATSLTLGLPMREILGKPLSMFLPIGERLLNDAKALPKDKDIVSSLEEASIRTKDGKELSVSLSSACIRDPSKELGGITVVAHNIEKLKEYIQTLNRQKQELEEVEAKLLDANLNLEEKIKQRTLQLEEMKDSLERLVEERTKELKERLLELERFKALTIDRELRMVELKKELEEMKKNIT